MSNTAVDVFGLGQCSLDCLGIIQAYPPPDVKCEFSDRVIQGGGPVATALVALSRWGLSCAMAGMIGDDLFGRMIRTSLEEEGIRTEGLVMRKGCLSQFAFIAAEPAQSRRTIFWQRPTGQELRHDEIPVDAIRRARVMHTDGLFMEAALHACRIARQAGIPVIVDAGTLREGMLDLARLSDCFIASEPFARALMGGDNPLEACRVLSALGPRVTGVTLGGKGYVALEGGKVIQKPAYPVQAIDTTGCGDVFHAGFTFGLLKGWDTGKSLDLGAWAASLVSLHMGGRSGIPNLLELRERGF